jgi:mono/diheme cytochrome c family protein
MPEFHPPARSGVARIAIAAVATIASAAALAAPPLPSPELQRGRALYETRCIGCHDRSVHQRESRLARDFATLRAQVIRWNANAGGEWRTEEIDQVSAYLNERYYKFTCPPEICKVPARAEVPPAGPG